MKNRKILHGDVRVIFVIIIIFIFFFYFFIFFFVVGGGEYVLCPLMLYMCWENMQFVSILRAYFGDYKGIVLLPVIPGILECKFNEKKEKKKKKTNTPVHFSCHHCSDMLLLFSADVHVVCLSCLP